MTLSVHDEGYSWNAPCALSWISMFLLHTSPLFCMTLLSVTNICVTNEHRYVRSHNLVLYPFMKYLRVCNKSNTTSSTSGTGTANSSGAPEFTFGFSGVLVARSLILYIMFGRLLFVVLYYCCYAIVRPSSIYGSVFPLWYLHALHPFVVNAIRAFLRSWLITWFVKRITWNRNCQLFRSTCVHPHF
jgi:hypothetical protein